MLTFSNLLSFLRLPLAFLFLLKSAPFRLVAVGLAMTTDVFDGYFARKNRTISQFGATLDPLMDRFFVYFVLVVFYLEKILPFTLALTFLSRDLAICLYGLYLLSSQKWTNLKIEALYFGKITTALQFFLIALLTLNYSFSAYVYLIFVLLGLLALFELFLRKNRCLKKVE